MQKVLIVFQLIKYMVADTAIIEPDFLNNENKELISYGELFDIQEYPFMVYFEAIKLTGYVGMCSGSLILPLFVLTAAHCTYQVDKYDIVVYRYNNTRKKDVRFVKKIYQHYLYDHYSGDNDISLLRLEYPFKDVSHYIKMSGHPNEFNNETSLNCIALGYGQTEKSKNLENVGYMTNLSIMYGQMDGLLHLFHKTKFSSQKILCSKPNMHNLCPGDSGGPLICNGCAYGIASFIYNAQNPVDVKCGAQYIQSGFLFIHFYRDWISNTILNTGNLIKLCDKLFNISVILMVYNFL